MRNEFNNTFCVPCYFIEETHHLSRYRFTKEEAVKRLELHFKKEIDPEYVKESFVRYQVASQEAYDETGMEYCWAEVPPSPDSFPTWVYG